MQISPDTWKQTNGCHRTILWQVKCEVNVNTQCCSTCHTCLSHSILSSAREELRKSKGLKLTGRYATFSLPVYLKANFRFRTTREQRSTKKSTLHSANAYEQQAPDVEVHTDFSIAMQSCNSNLRRTSTASFHLLYDPWVSLLTTMVTLLTTDPGRDRWTVKLSNLKNVHYSRDSLILWPLSNSASFKKGQKKANWFIDSTRE